MSGHTWQGSFVPWEEFAWPPYNHSGILIEIFGIHWVLQCVNSVETSVRKKSILYYILTSEDVLINSLGHNNVILLDTHNKKWNAMPPYAKSFSINTFKFIIFLFIIIIIIIILSIIIVLSNIVSIIVISDCKKVIGKKTKKTRDSSTKSPFITFICKIELCLVCQWSAC